MYRSNARASAGGGLWSDRYTDEAVDMEYSIVAADFIYLFFQLLSAIWA